MGGDKHTSRPSGFVAAVHAAYAVGNNDVLSGRAGFAHLPERTYQHHSRYSHVLSAIPALHGNFLSKVFTDKYSIIVIARPTTAYDHVLSKHSKHVCFNIDRLL